MDEKENSETDEILKNVDSEADQLANTLKGKGGRKAGKTGDEVDKEDSESENDDPKSTTEKEQESESQSTKEGPLMTEAQFMKKQKSKLEAEAKHKASL
jgi:hypothetical protein